MSLYEIFNNAACTYPNNLAILFFKDENSSKKVTYKELQFESLKVQKICELQKDKNTLQGSLKTSTSVHHEASFGSGCHQSVHSNHQSVHPSHQSVHQSHQSVHPSHQSVHQSHQSVHSSHQSVSPSLQSTNPNLLSPSMCVSSIPVGNIEYYSCDNINLANIVGVMCQPGPLSVACMLGIMKSCTFFYISPSWKVNEIKPYLKRVNPFLLFVEECYADKMSIMPVKLLGKLQVFDTSFLYFSYYSNERYLPHKYEFTEVAYVIPTSGTTGIPKMVFVPPKCIIPNILDFFHMYQVTLDDRIFCASPPTFDPSIVDIFVAFKAGASLVMVPLQLVKIPNLLLDIMIQSKTTVLQATPSLLFSLGKERLKTSLLGSESKLKILALGGETFPKLSVLKGWMDVKCKTRIFNLYGITEVSCWASAAEVFKCSEVLQIGCKSVRLNCSDGSLLEKQGTSFSGRDRLLESARKPTEISKTSTRFDKDLFQELVAIGDPLSLTVIKLLNNSGQEVDVEDEEGEIFIGGHERVCWIDSGLEISKESLSSCEVKHYDDWKLENYPHEGRTQQTQLGKSLVGMISEQKKLIMRRTGDRGVIKRGKIYCLGRLDRQVKRHGQKVSLSEIERQSRTLDYVENCHVTIFQENRIAAYVQVGDDKQTVTSVQKDFTNLMSDWKLPDVIHIVKSLPFNSHGKVDESQLLNLEKHKSDLNNHNSYDSTFTQQFVRLLWQRILGIECPSDRDNFIESGGTSLNALSFVEELEDNFNVRLPTLLGVLLNKTYQEVTHQVDMSVCSRYLEGSTSKKGYKKIKVEGNKDKSHYIETLGLQYGQLKHKSLHIEHRENDLLKHHKLEIDPLVDRISSQIHSVVTRRGTQGSSKSMEISYKHFCIQFLWKYNMDKCVDSSPIIVEYESGRKLLMVGSHSNQFVCIDVNTGNHHWCIKLGGRIESSPSLSNDGRYVYIGCYDCNLYCVSIAVGEVRWKFSAEAEIKSSPIVDGKSGQIIFGSHDKNVYCVTSDGNLEWKVKLSEGSVFSSPCIVGDQVFSATLDGVVAGIDKKIGKINWKRYQSKPIFTSLTPFSKGIVFATVHGEILGYSLIGDRLWNFKTNGPVFSSAFVKELENGLEIIAIGCHDHCTYFLNNSGVKIAVYQCKSPIYSVPFMFLLDVRHVVRTVICETAGMFYLVDLVFNASGKINTSDSNPICTAVNTVSKCKAKGEIFSSPIVLGSKLFICSRDNFVHCYKFVTKDTTKKEDLS